MDIYAKEGTKVIYTGENGYDHDREHADKYLTKDAVYTVDNTDVEGWHTSVYLKEFPEIAFNSVHFEEALVTKFTKEQIEKRLMDMLYEMLSDYNQEDGIISVEYIEGSHECTVKMNVNIVEEDDYVGFGSY